MNIMKIAQWILGGAMLPLLTMETVTAQRFSQEDDSRIRPTRMQTGTFYSLTLNQPPFPFNPFPELVVTELQPGVFVYDDRIVDYVQLRAELAALQVEKAALLKETEEEESGSGGMTAMMGSGIQLQSDVFDGTSKRISFNSEPGLVYDVEESIDLANWTVLQTLVASDTETSVFSAENGYRFFRVRGGDERIQFPEWQDFIEQYMHFDVWTPLAGTYQLELFGDGTLVYSTTQLVPANGHFGVYDVQGYDPTQWPYTGYYGVDEWELRVTVTPAAPSGGAQAEPPATTTVKKKGRRRHTNPEYTGITVQQYGVVSTEASAQDELDEMFMPLYFLANLQATRQIDLNGALLNQFNTVATTINNASDWALLLTRMTSPTETLDYLHYFGHGSVGLIGSGTGPGTKITTTQLQLSKLKTQPMTYVVFDGCRSAENTAFIGGCIGHTKSFTRQKFIDEGWTPRFGAGWDGTKRAEYLLQGTLVYDHFNFWVDFYNYLTERDLGGNGYMFHSYREAYEFAKTPNNNGVNPNREINFEAEGFVAMGCYDCVFDQ